MKANELRTGNYLNHNGNWNYNDHNGVFQFTDSDWYAIGECTLDLNDIKPIPLTEEWLLKFVLNKQISVFEIFGDDQRGFHIDLGNEWLFIKHVHQLQNLYFALTGCELEIK